MKVLFLDESGDNNLSAVDPQYPVFVLGGVIIDKEYADGLLAREINDFKTEFFGRSDIILHTADIIRNKNGFESLTDSAFRERFYRELNALMRRLTYTIVACVIRKRDHLGRYGDAALDPYLFSLHVLIERFYHDIGKDMGGGIIVAETRSPALDRDLDLAWQNLRETRYLQAKDIKSRVLGLHLRPKRDNIAGLQLADLVVSPIGRHVLGKPEKQDWGVIKGKLRRNPRTGEVSGHGLVILPKKRG